MSGTILAPKDYELAMKRAVAAYPATFMNVTDPQERDRKARNILAAQKIWERADYGPLADVRELVALRLAPWLRPDR